MSAATFVTITTDDKYFIPEVCKPYIGRHKFLASDLPNFAANMPLYLNAFRRMDLKVTVTFVCLVVLNVTFNNISVISWRSVLLEKETEGPGENN